MTRCGSITWPIVARDCAEFFALGYVCRGNTAGADWPLESALLPEIVSYTDNSAGAQLANHIGTTAASHKARIPHLAPHQ